MPRPSTPETPRRWAGALLALVGLSLALVSCSSDKGARVQNIPPHVRLSGGPIQGDSVSYTAEFFWTGWDEDGIIDHYQYAIDIPDSLIWNLDNPDEQRIAWVDTTAFRASFLFTTPLQDSVLMPDLTYYLPDRYRGDHHFYVRAVDNEGGISPADKVGFTARTITPITTITLPKVASTATVLEVGRQINVAWAGVDPDNPDPSRRPSFYEWKLVPGIGSNPAGINVQYAVTVRPGADYAWTRISADTTSLRLNLNPPEEYVLAIRAIDEAGGVEGKFYNGQNALVLQSAISNPGTPILAVSEKALGSARFPTEMQVWEVEVAVGRCLTFIFNGDATSYGGELQGYNYGIDVPDIEQEGPTSGFRGWSKYPGTYDPICFGTPGIHTLTVKARDTGGGVTIATIILTVISFPLDRDILYVDDFNLGASGPLVNDAMMDRRARAMLQAVGYQDSRIWQFDAHGPGDRDAFPTQLKLSDLSRYRTLLWSCWGVGYAGQTALVAANACGTGRILQTYVQAGGTVWLYGRQLFGAFRAFSASTCMGTLGYDATNELNFTGDEFPVQFVGITPGGFHTVKTDFARDGLLRAYPTAEARGEFYPTVEVDSTVFTGAQGGLGGVDAMYTPAYSTWLDTLYTMETPKPNSKFRNKPVAFRYYNPDPGNTEGPVAVFGFPFHQLKPGAVHEESTDQGVILKGTGVHGMAASMFRWFSQNQRQAKAG